jgi:hypothetical protein
LIPENTFQHLSTCIEIDRQPFAGELSGSIKIYRLARPSRTAATDFADSEESARKARHQMIQPVVAKRFFDHFFTVRLVGGAD